MVLVQHLGAGPFLRAFDRITIGALGAALLVTAVTTLCCAWRWTWVAGRLDLRLDVRAAVPAYYRSQLVNQVLPGGVLGDVDRAVRHGERRGGAGSRRPCRGVGPRPGAGRAGRPCPARRGRPSLGAARHRAVLTSGRTRRRWPRRPAAAAARRRGPEELRDFADARCLFGGPWLPLVLSVAAAAGHLLVLLVALRTTGVDVPLPRQFRCCWSCWWRRRCPTNIAGWGPREGVAAWVFAPPGSGLRKGSRWRRSTAS